MILIDRLFSLKHKHVHDQPHFLPSYDNFKNVYIGYGLNILLRTKIFGFKVKRIRKETGHSDYNPFNIYSLLDFVSLINILCTMLECSLLDSDVNQTNRK